MSDQDFDFQSKRGKGPFRGDNSLKGLQERYEASSLGKIVNGVIRPRVPGIQERYKNVPTPTEDEVRYMLGKLEDPNSRMERYEYRQLENAAEKYLGEHIKIVPGYFGGNKVNDAEKAVLARLAKEVGYQSSRKDPATTATATQQSKPEVVDKSTQLEKPSPQELLRMIDTVLDKDRSTRLTNFEKGQLIAAVKEHDENGKGVRFWDGLTRGEKGRLIALRDSLNGNQTEELSREERLVALIDTALADDFKKSDLTRGERRLLSKEVKELTGKGVRFGNGPFGDGINARERQGLEQLRDSLKEKIAAKAALENPQTAAPQDTPTKPPSDDSTPPPAEKPAEATSGILSRAGELRGSRDYLRDLDKIEVNILQQQLKAAGIDPGPIDGKFGEITMKAAKEYIQKNDLDINISFENLQKHLEGKGKTLDVGHNTSQDYEEQINGYARAAAQTDNINPGFQTAALDQISQPQPERTLDTSAKPDIPGLKS